MRATKAAELNRRQREGIRVPTPIEEARDQMRDLERERASDFNAVLSSPQGQAVIAYLRERFAEGRLFDSDPVVMGYHIGRRDMVKFIEDMARLGHSMMLEGDDV